MGGVGTYGYTGNSSISSLGCQAVAPPRCIRHRHLITLNLAMSRRKRVSGCVAHCRRVLVAHSAVAELLFCAFEAGTQPAHQTLLKLFQILRIQLT